MKHLVLLPMCLPKLSYFIYTHVVIGNETPSIVTNVFTETVVFYTLYAVIGNKTPSIVTNVFTETVVSILFML